MIRALGSKSIPLRDPDRGMSLVEVLIAAAIMLVIALGVIPYFAQAMQNNAQGQDSTKVANFSRSRLEHFIQLPFNHPDLTLLAGPTRAHNEHYLPETYDSNGSIVQPAAWVDSGGAPPPEATYVRTTTIRQFSSDDLTAELDAAADPSAVNVKEIQVQTRATRTAGPLGGGKQLTVRFYKVK